MLSLVMSPALLLAAMVCCRYMAASKVRVLYVGSLPLLLVGYVGSRFVLEVVLGGP